MMSVCVCVFLFPCVLFVSSVYGPVYGMIQINNNNNNNNNNKIML